MTPNRVYIAGPMRGYRGFNFPAFFEAEARIREQYPDADVMNPAREDVAKHGLHQTLIFDPTGLTAGLALTEGERPFTNADLREALAADIAYILSADLVVCLPGWRESKGALAEVAAANAVGVLVAELGEEVPEGHPDPESPGEPRQGLADAISALNGAAKALRSAGREPVHEVWEAVFGGQLRHERDGEAAEKVSERETRMTAASGGQKGVKPEQFDQMPPAALFLLAEHFGKGAAKYSAHNFRKGYPWSYNYNALLRHLLAFWGGEDYDSHTENCTEDCVEHTGSLHIVAVMWHAMVLTQFFIDRKEYDDRYRG